MSLDFAKAENGPGGATDEKSWECSARPTPLAYVWKKWQQEEERALCSPGRREVSGRAGRREVSDPGYLTTNLHACDQSFPHFHL